MGVWGTVCRPRRAEEAQGRCGRQDDTCLPASGTEAAEMVMK